MNILMMTNTYKPHTGGVARSVQWFSEALTALDHRVMVVAPTFADMAPHESNVVRVPAIQQFNGSDFSVRLPIPGLLGDFIDEFRPEIVHAHHPFLLGDTAVRVAALRDLPIVFTHHTMYEQYTHYVPGDSPAMQRFAIRLATEFANLCDHVIAPSESIVAVLRERGVKSDITAIPTGIDPEQFVHGEGSRARRTYDIPNDAFVVGHVGRLAPEKNLLFLANAVCRFLEAHPDARFLLVGEGPSLEDVIRVCQERNVEDRLHHPERSLAGQQLADAYHAMDVFAFASHSETQGMVLAEAMMAGVPVVAVDAPGAREVVRDGMNGRLLLADDEARFAEALSWYAQFPVHERDRVIAEARRTAKHFTLPRCAARLLKIYQQLADKSERQRSRDDSDWAAIGRLIEEEWKILSNVTNAVGDAVFGVASRRDPVS